MYLLVRAASRDLAPIPAKVGREGRMVRWTGLRNRSGLTIIYCCMYMYAPGFFLQGEPGNSWVWIGSVSGGGGEIIPGFSVHIRVE